LLLTEKQTHIRDFNVSHVEESPIVVGVTIVHKQKLNWRNNERRFEEIDVLGLN
jgi:hypothetical protein